MSNEAIEWVLGLPKTLINSSEAHLLLLLAYRCGNTTECWPSIRSICESTKMNRKTVIQHRQSLINKGLLKFTGNYKGRQNQIPIMQLMVIKKLSTTSTKNGTGESFTSTVFGTGTSTVFGTGTSTKNGTRKYKEEEKDEVCGSGATRAAPTRTHTEFLSEKNKALFDEKFKGYDLTIETLLESYLEYNEGKVTNAYKFRIWIEREKLENYKKKSNVITYPPINMAEQERISLAKANIPFANATREESLAALKRLTFKTVPR